MGNQAAGAWPVAKAGCAVRRAYCRWVQGAYCRWCKGRTAATFVSDDENYQEKRCRRKSPKVIRSGRALWEDDCVFQPLTHVMCYVSTAQHQLQVLTSSDCLG